MALKGGWKAGYRVRILTPAGAPEIAQLNNTVTAPRFSLETPERTRSGGVA
uniref:Uncharacterized protein n=1 Tax=Caulobacter sp. (strain K31) TaxID=366602 RepID=B0T4K7_CAUSK